MVVLASAQGIPKLTNPLHCHLHRQRPARAADRVLNTRSEVRRVQCGEIEGTMIDLLTGSQEDGVRGIGARQREQERERARESGLVHMLTVVDEMSMSRRAVVYDRRTASWVSGSHSAGNLSSRHGSGSLSMQNPVTA
jgi:hypothetical protein